jgi:hypothetical protein
LRGDVLTAEELKDWMALPASPTPAGSEYGYLRFPPVIQRMIGSPGGTEMSTVGAKLSGLPGDPDYRATNVFSVLFLRIHFSFTLGFGKVDGTLPTMKSIMNLYPISNRNDGKTRKKRYAATG